MINKSAAVKEKVQELVQTPPPESFRHADTKDRHGKKYKRKSVFSLDDDGSDDEPFALKPGKAKPDTEKAKVSLESYLAQADVLECFELCISFMMSLERPASLPLNSAIPPNCHPRYQQRNSPKSSPFKFGYEVSPGENTINASHRFLVPKAGECAKAFGADLSHFYDGFLNAGSVYLLSASPDEHLDYSRVHTLNLQSRQINTHQCRGDPSRGFPPARKQAGLASVPGFILLAGGEVADQYNVHRLQDYWVLNCDTFEWTQVPASMPCPLIEPRITTCNSGKVYLWGDHDVPLPGMPQQGTHLRILKSLEGKGFVHGSNIPFLVSGMENYKTPPPSYDQSAGHSVPSYQQNNTPTPPAYPSYQPMGGQQQPAPQMGFNTGGSSPYPQNQSSPYPQGGAAPYGGQPSYPTQGGSYPRQDYGGNQGEYQPGPAPGTQAYYPPQKKDKDCSIIRPARRYTQRQVFSRARRYCHSKRVADDER
ncbi:unnamed protein product, partial [Mesorhabditis spiculigera]